MADLEVSRREATVTALDPHRASSAEPVVQTAGNAASPTTDAATGELYQHPRRWLIFFIVATAMMMGSIDQTVVATALPTLHRDLHAAISWTAWTVTMYQLGQVIAMPVAGRISDQFGRRKVFLCCLVLFAASSVVCGLSNSIYVLIGFRALQALGAGAFMPSATGIVVDNFGKDRDRGVGLFTSIVPIGSLIGPVIGGIIIYYWSWRGVFFINVPIAITIFVLAVIFVPRSKGKDVPHADIIGIGLLAGSILPLMYAITTLGNGHVSITTPQFFVPALASVVVGAVFIKRSFRIETPIIPMPLLRGRAFATMNFISLMYGGCVLGFGALVPLYAEERYHFLSIQAGTILTARGIGVLCVAGATAMLLRRLGYRLPMVLGFGSAAVGMVLLGFGAHGLMPYAWLAASAAIMGMGNGMAAPATNNAILSLAPGDVASISGLRGMFRQIGAIVAVSVTTAIVTRSTDPGLALGHAFEVFAAVVVVIVIPLALTVPNRKGSW